MIENSCTNTNVNADYDSNSIHYEAVRADSIDSPISKNKQVFIINGSGGTGKDSFIDFVGEMMHLWAMCYGLPRVDLIENWMIEADKCDPRGYIWSYSSVSKVKRVAREMGWDYGKTEKDRKFLSDMKVLFTGYNDAPFNSMRKIVADFYDSPEPMILFLHIREPEEIERAKNEFHAVTILVERKAAGEIKSNMADANVNNYHYDIIIKNEGYKQDLARVALCFVGDYMNGYLSYDVVNKKARKPYLTYSIYDPIHDADQPSTET